ncbi:hypothetical protein ACVW0P_000093 [Mucilaginibacter sp. UYNi724]
MERLTLQIPEKKSKLIKSLLKELGVIIEPNLLKLTKEFDSRPKPDVIPTMDEIVAEVRAVRSARS